MLYKRQLPPFLTINLEYNRFEWLSPGGTIWSIEMRSSCEDDIPKIYLQTLGSCRVLIGELVPNSPNECLI